MDIVMNFVAWLRLGLLSQYLEDRFLWFVVSLISIRFFWANFWIWGMRRVSIVRLSRFTPSEQGLGPDVCLWAWRWIRYSHAMWMSEVFYSKAESSGGSNDRTMRGLRIRTWHAAQVPRWNQKVSMMNWSKEQMIMRSVFFECLKAFTPRLINLHPP